MEAVTNAAIPDGGPFAWRAFCNLAKNESCDEVKVQWDPAAPSGWTVVEYTDVIGKFVC